MALHVFLLEDHDDTRNLLKLHIERLGHTVWTASSVREAMGEIRKADFDFLLCDIGLADGLGWSFLESLHFSKPVFAVAMSGVGEPQDVARSRLAGFRDHLVKPLNIPRLNGLLAEAEQGGPAPSKFSGGVRNE